MKIDDKYIDTYMTEKQMRERIGDKINLFRQSVDYC